MPHPSTNPPTESDKSRFQSNRFLFENAKDKKQKNDFAYMEEPTAYTNLGTRGTRAVAPHAASALQSRFFNGALVGDAANFGPSKTNRQGFKPSEAPTTHCRQFLGYFSVSACFLCLGVLVAFLSLWRFLPLGDHPLIPLGQLVPNAPWHMCQERITALEQVVYRLSRDTIALHDFALRFNGAQIIDELTTVPPKGSKRGDINPAITALDDDLHPGRCWRLASGSGQLGIILSARIRISHVTIDHIPKELTTAILHAPSTFHVWGAINTNSAQSMYPPDAALHGPPISAGYQFLSLGSFRYDIHSNSNIQTFPILSAISQRNLTFEKVVFQVDGNWGGGWTCLYRVRVHGTVDE